MLHATWKWLIKWTERMARTYGGTVYENGGGDVTIRTTYAVELRIPRSPQRLDLVRLTRRFDSAAAARDWAEDEWPGKAFNVVREPHEEIVRFEEDG